jgi:hypothetical protein
MVTKWVAAGENAGSSGSMSMDSDGRDDCLRSGTGSDGVLGVGLGVLFVTLEFPGDVLVRLHGGLP